LTDGLALGFFAFLLALATKQFPQLWFEGRSGRSDWWGRSIAVGIVGGWALFVTVVLLLIAMADLGVVTKVLLPFIVIGFVLIALTFLLFLTTAVFKWPRFAIPPHQRDSDPRDRRSAR
jgi:hypothetical protein